MRLNPQARLKNSTSKNSRSLRGIRAEVLFIKKCLRNGFNIEQPINSAVDFHINGKPVEIKSCFSPTKTNKYKYTASKSQVENAEFFAFYHPFNNSFFIIPNNIQTTDKYSYSITLPVLIDKNHKWFKYQNDFECFNNLKHRQRPLPVTFAPVERS